MKILNPSILLASTAIILASCGGSAPIISTPIGNIDSQPLKIQTLTDEELKSWPLKDLVTDTIPGMSVEKAYNEIIKNRKGETVIVGVIDSGVDIEHEDLKDVLWVNKGEIAGNGKDDDGNGYIDDIHGWNFLGDITGEALEYVRILKKLSPKFEGKTESSISAADRADYALYNKVKAEYDKSFGEATSNKARYEGLISQVSSAHEAMTNKFGKADYTSADLKTITNPTSTEQQQIGMLTQMLASGESIPNVIEQIQGGVNYFTNQLKYNLNMSEDFRSVLGDNRDDINDKVYGDNNVSGPDPTRENVLHGTHVAGIIAAKRGNGIGMDGVANNVQILTVRAVPDGDEDDKDIALGIRYAVDNGAKVLNTSFGKYYSTNPEWVWDALKYAASKDVLIVNAAGNEGEDLDLIQVYPNDQTVENPTEVSDSFITIGALNYEYGGELVANFSNYGKSNVDAFAPGVKIWATTPLNTYKFLQGTSMASPEVAGVAAIIRSYYPKLSAKQVKQILMDSGLSSSTAVVLGGDPSNTKPFSTISKSGKMVNLYNALIMAEKMSK